MIGPATDGPAVLVGFDDRAGGAEPPGGLERHDLLRRAGLDEEARVAPGIAPVHLTLGADGWRSLNLGALVAIARAHPGWPVQAAGAALALSPGEQSERTFPSRPVPHTVAPPTTVLLDRDGTILQPIPYLKDPAQVALLPGAAEGLRELATRGCRLVVLTNQSGVGRGIMTQADVTAVHARMAELLSERGIRLDGIFTCPHLPEAGCDCRKPATGLARTAASALGLDLTRAVVVGDSPVDIGLARQLHVPAVLVLTGNGPTTLAAGGEGPDLAVTDLGELARICAHPAGLGLEPFAATLP